MAKKVSIKSGKRRHSKGHLRRKSATPPPKKEVIVDEKEPEVISAISKEPATPAWIKGAQIGCACLVVLLFLAAVSTVVLYATEMDKQISFEQAIRQIRGFATKYNPNILSENDMDAFSLALNLSDEFNNWISKTAELQVEMEDVQQKLLAGWQPFGMHLLFFSKTRKSWWGARAECQKEGTELITVETAEKEDFIEEEANRSGQNFWIGLSKQDSMSSTARWADLLQSNTWYWDTSSHQPDSTLNENCVFVHHKCRPRRCWHDHPCYLKLRFICDKVPPKRFVID